LAANWSSLTAYLEQSDAGRIVLSFSQIETIIGGALPPSARRHRALWSNSSTYAKAWTSAGSGHMGFERTTSYPRRRGSARDDERAAVGVNDHRYIRGEARDR
jgi:hypothetical protein